MDLIKYNLIFKYLHICLCNVKCGDKGFIYVRHIYCCYLEQERSFYSNEMISKLGRIPYILPQKSHSPADSERSIVKYQRKCIKSLSLPILSATHLSTFIDPFGIKNVNKSSIKHQTYFNSIKPDYYRLLFA